MIYYYEVFATEADAEAFREQQYLAYHPLGYSTHIRIEQDPYTKKWVARGSRAESCD